MKLPEVKSFQLEFMDGNIKKLNALGETSKEVFSDVGSSPTASTNNTEDSICLYAVFYLLKKLSSKKCFNYNIILFEV